MYPKKGHDYPALSGNILLFLEIILLFNKLLLLQWIPIPYLLSGSSRRDSVLRETLISCWPWNVDLQVTPWLRRTSMSRIVPDFWCQWRSPLSSSQRSQGDHQCCLETCRGLLLFCWRTFCIRSWWREIQKWSEDMKKTSILKAIILFKHILLEM